MNKRKQSQNPLVYWWNEFLFARYFEYESDLTPEEIAEQLEAIAHKRQGWIWGLEKTVKVEMHPNEKGLDFDVQSRRRRMFDPIGITTARTLGTATVDSATGRTIVTGDVKLGRIIQLFFFGYLSIILVSILPLMMRDLATTSGGILFAMTSPIVIIGIVFALLWWRIYTDRNNLAEHIEAAMMNEKAKRAVGRLNESDEYDEYANDDNEQHKRQQHL